VNELLQQKSRNRRLFIAVFGTLLLLIGYFIINSYFSHLQKSKREVLNKLEAVAKTAALMVNAEEHEHLFNTFKKGEITQNTHSPIYFSIHQKLRSVQKTNDLTTAIRTLKYDSLNHTFDQIISSAVTPGFKNPISKFPAQMARQYHIGGTLDNYSVKSGEWLSAIAPIKNKNSQTVAIVQVEQNFYEFLDTARKQLWINIAISLSVFAFISLLLLKFLRFFVKKEEEFINMIIEQNNEINSQNEEIELQNHWIQENNQKLEEAKKTIETQNRDLKILNQILDIKVTQRTKELEMTNQDMKAFLYRSSHDIMGPIATMKGLINLAKIEIQDPVVLDYFAKFNQTIDKLSQIVKSVNAIFDIKNKEIELTTFNLKAFVEDFIEKNFARVHTNITFIINIPAELQINTDEALLRIVFYQIIKNAITHKTRNTDKIPVVEICAEKAVRKIIISVSDNGIGIMHDTKERINEIFSNGNIISESPGMGLNIAKSALNKLKGEIALVNKPDYTTTFEFYLRQKR
jgi:signal transduction histidine kinase